MILNEVSSHVSCTGHGVHLMFVSKILDLGLDALVILRTLFWMSLGSPIAVTWPEARFDSGMQQLRALPFCLHVNAHTAKTGLLTQHVKWCLPAAAELRSTERLLLLLCNSRIMARTWICRQILLLITLWVNPSVHDGDKASCDGAFDIYFVLDRWILHALYSIVAFCFIGSRPTYLLGY